MEVRRLHHMLLTFICLCMHSAAVQGVQLIPSFSVQGMQLIAFDCGILHGPPNTLLAARRALQAGATALNVDLTLTNDGKLIAAHSSTHWLHLKGLPPIGKDLSELNSSELPRTPPCSTFHDYWRSIGIPEDELKELEECGPQSMSSAEEFLDAFPSVPLHFDLKADSLELQRHQAQLLSALLHDKFPARARVTNGSLTSVRFFQDPKRMVEQEVLSLMQQDFWNSSLAVFLGDPADELYATTKADSHLSSNQQEDAGLLHVLSKGPEFVPTGTRGVYLPPKVMEQGWTVPQSWKHSLFLVCDVAAEGLKILTAEQRKLQRSVCLSAGSKAVHTAFFQGWKEEPPAEHLGENPAKQQNKFLSPVRIALAPVWALTFKAWPGIITTPPQKEKWRGTSWTRCASKHVTAMLVVRLIELGKIASLDSLVWDLLQLTEPPQSIHEDIRKLTLREVMSGVGGFKASSEESAWEFLPGLPASQRSLAALTSINLTDLTSKKFVYSNQQWAVVERVVEAATNFSLPAAARHYLFKDIGLSNGTYYMDDSGTACPEFQRETQRQRNLRGGIGMCSTPDDLLLLTRTLAEGGVSPVTKRRVLSLESLHELLTDQLATHFPMSVQSALESFPCDSLRRVGFPVIGRTLGAFVLQGGVVMAHGGHHLFVGAKMILRLKNGRPARAAFAQLAYTPTYYNEEDFTNNIPTSIDDAVRCEMQFHHVGDPWRQYTEKNASFVPPCHR